MVPIKSAGNKSGVNCIRLNLASIQVAKVLMANVLANPGTPSNKICPLLSKPINKRSTMWLCPTITLFISEVNTSTNALSRCIRSFNSLMSTTIFLFNKFVTKLVMVGVSAILVLLKFVNQKAKNCVRYLN